MAAYAASKSGLIGLTQVLAVEFGGKNIRANAILPGGTNTPMGRIMTNTPEARAFISGLHALKRIAEPEEIAQSVLYLASDASKFTTGTALLVDGGDFSQSNLNVPNYDRCFEDHQTACGYFLAWFVISNTGGRQFHFRSTSASGFLPGR